LTLGEGPPQQSLAEQVESRLSGTRLELSRGSFAVIERASFQTQGRPSVSLELSVTSNDGDRAGWMVDILLDPRDLAIFQHDAGIEALCQTVCANAAEWWFTRGTSQANENQRGRAL
jgi:hypothetical protein